MTDNIDNSQENKTALAQFGTLSSRKSAQAQKKLPSAQIDNLFLRFLAIWDKKWADKIVGMELDVQDEWAEALGRFSVEQIRAAISAAREKCPWPPSIAEFIGLITTNKPIKPDIKAEKEVDVRGCACKSGKKATIFNRQTYPDWLCEDCWAKFLDDNQANQENK